MTVTGYAKVESITQPDGSPLEGWHVEAYDTGLRYIAGKDASPARLNRMGCPPVDVTPDEGVQIIHVGTNAAVIVP